jgi:hypothetical protein
MFAFIRGRPSPCARACQSHWELCAYLEGSGDRTDAFLETALAKVRETAARWAVAKGNSTSSYAQITIGARTCAMLEAFLVSLLQSPGNAHTEGAFAAVAERLRITGGNSRLEKVVQEVGQRDPAKQSEATASSGGQVIVL